MKIVLLGAALGCAASLGVFAAHCAFGDARYREPCEAQGGHWSHAVDWRHKVLLHVCSFGKHGSV